MIHLFRNILLLTCTCYAIETWGQARPGFLAYQDDQWVDSVLSRMNTEQKIAQLFMVQAYSRESQPAATLISEVRDIQVGGVLFMQGTAANQKAIIRDLQKQSKVPLLIAMDAEWGPAFRLKDTPAYPVQMALGAIRNDSLIYQMGLEIGSQLKRMGVHVNFAPVADVNNNPNNPVINYRSFGEDPEKVSRKAWLYAKGMQDAGVLAVAKHFPGHGDTRTDSHHALPLIRKDVAELRRKELYPFEQLIRNGIGGIMTAHLEVPALEPQPGLPSSLSDRIIRNILINEFGFRGLIITDAMNMKGVSGQFGSGEAAVRALQAGNDMLEVVPDLAVAVKAVKEAVASGRISPEDLERKCRKILMIKRWLRLNRDQPDQTEDPGDPYQFELTRRLLHEQSLTLLRNSAQLLPLQRLDTLKVAVVSIGNSRETPFQRMSARYIQSDFFQIRENAGPQEIDRLIKLLAPYNLLICGIHNLNQFPASQYGTDSSIAYFLSKTENIKRIVTLFGNPYALNFITGIEETDALMVTYQENQITQDLAAQAIFGAFDVTGRLPVNVSTIFRMNDGIDLKKNFRLKYSLPEEAGISSVYLSHRIDSLAGLGLQRKAYPGCQVLIARNGKVIYQKCYGFHSYEHQRPVTEETLYDLASLTKIMASVPALMKLYGEGKINLDNSFSNYWPAFKGTDKSGMTLRQMLAHQARFLPGIAFWNKVPLKNGKPDPLVFQDRPSPQFNIRVSGHLYMNKDHIQVLYDQIRDSQLLKRTQYAYSDLPFYLFPKMIGNLTGENFEDYLKRAFYRPLGANAVIFNPYLHYPLTQIAPTENDDYFRKELVHGFVHDEGAAMFGGVSGNAGLFATANDLAKIMQMYLQGGYYGGARYLSPSAVEEFTRIQFPENKNRRGLGFDKPYINNYLFRSANAYPAPDAGPNSYGHTGFTGTFVWADPDRQMIIIFLSNRINPSRGNTRLSALSIRAQMLQTVYDSIQKGINP